MFIELMQHRGRWIALAAISILLMLDIVWGDGSCSKAV